MNTEPRRVCSICGNEFSGAMEFCPVCMLREALAGVKHAQRQASVTQMLGGSSVHSAPQSLLKIESDINGILPAGGGPLPFISFRSLTRLSGALRRVTVFCVRQPLARSSPQAADRKSFWDLAAAPKRRFAFRLVVG